jgi:hypothetical protein
LHLKPDATDTSNRVFNAEMAPGTRPAAKESLHGKPSLKTFTVEGGLRLYAVSPADAQAEAFANQDGQVYFGKGKVTLKEGKQLSSSAKRAMSSDSLDPSGICPTLSHNMRMSP